MSNTPTSSAQVAEGLSLEAELAAPELLPRYTDAVAVVKEQQRASVSLVQRRLRISWNAARDLVESMLDRGDVPLDWAPPVYQLAARRAAPVAEGVALPPLDADSLPPLSKERIIELAEAWGMTRYGYENDPRGHCIDFARAIESAVLDEHVAPYAERIRQLERELATFKGEHATQLATKSIDTPEFRVFMDDYDNEASYGSLKKARAALIAYIDGRTAGPAVPGPCRNCAGFGWEPSFSGERRPCGFCRAAAPKPQEDAP